MRALEAIAGTALALGPEELGAAERAGRALVRAAPFRESGYRVLMTVFERNANAGEALRVYDELRCLLRDELGVAPGAELQAAHARLLGAEVRPQPPPA